MTISRQQINSNVQISNHTINFENMGLTIDHYLEFEFCQLVY
jgi:hypothetical protein